MPTEERCARHPGAEIVGPCDGCGEALCLACAVPVRGRVLGPRCLEAELGEAAFPDPPPTPPAADPIRRTADLGLALALLATALPWSSVGLGASPFGAWGADLRWSSLVAAAALLGSAAAATSRARWRRAERRADVVGVASSLVALLGAALAIGFPPPYTTRVVAPWIAGLAAAVALGANVAAMRRGDA